VAQGDVLVVDFTPSVDGHVLEKGKSTDFMLEVGKGSVHPDFDGNLLGHELGEAFSFEIVYPDNAPTKEVAGKHVQMDVTIKELKEKILPEANDDFAKEVDSDTFDALRQATRERLASRLEERRTSDIRNQIVDQLVKSTTFTLTDKVLDQEVQRMVDQLVQQFQNQGLAIDPARFNTPEIRESYKPQAEANVKRRLILMKISEVEGIELTDEEREQVYEEYAKILRIDVEELKEKYSGVGFIEQALDYKMDEKIMKLLEESAIIKDGPRDPEGAENQE
jgi:trigger factor